MSTNYEVPHIKCKHKTVNNNKRPQKQCNCNHKATNCSDITITLPQANVDCFLRKRLVEKQRLAYIKPNAVGAKPDTN
jgi:hypothetical protein